MIANFKKAVEICKQNLAYKQFYKSMSYIYKSIIAIKYTGNLIEYFDKYKDSKRKDSNTFDFLNDYGIINKKNVSVYLIKHFPNEINHKFTISDLAIGNAYTNSEIMVVFNVKNVGGLRKYNKLNALVIIAIYNKELYNDYWTKDGILNYTGMGKKGNQSINFAQNKTLNNSKRNDTKLYLFECYKKNEYYYRGEVELAGSYFYDKELDKDGKVRSVIKFPLKLKDSHRK